MKKSESAPAEAPQSSVPEKTDVIPESHTVEPKRGGSVTIPKEGSANA